MAGIPTAHPANKALILQIVCHLVGALIDINAVVALPGLGQPLVLVGKQRCDEVHPKLLEELRPCEGLVVGTLNAVTVVDFPVHQGHSEDNPMIRPTTTSEIDAEEIVGVIVVLHHIVVQPLLGDWLV